MSRQLNNPAALPLINPCTQVHTHPGCLLHCKGFNIHSYLSCFQSLVQQFFGVQHFHIGCRNPFVPGQVPLENQGMEVKIELNIYDFLQVLQGSGIETMEDN